MSFISNTVIGRLWPFGGPSPDDIRQTAALCYRKRAEGIEVLLVRSSRGRWILPKGWPEDGLTDAETARLEAWEEAGVSRGTIEDDPVATVESEKLRKDGVAQKSEIAVYPLEVDKTVSRYPEAGSRERRWLPLSKAVTTIDDDGMREALEEFAAQHAA